MSALTPAMTRDEARAAIDQVVDHLEAGLSSFEAAKRVAAQIEARHGYRALGFATMAACLQSELRVSRARAYQVMDEIRQSALLEQATGEPVVITAREAQVLKRAPGTVQRVRQLVAEGHTPREAVEHVTAEPITRSRFADGGFSPDFDGDNEGVMVLRCKGCQRVGPVGARFEVLRDGHADAGDEVRRERFIE